MTAGGRPDDYDLDRDHEHGVIAMALVVGLAVAMSSWMGFFREPCYPAVCLALTIVACACRRHDAQAAERIPAMTDTSCSRERSAPCLQVGWCQLAVFWVVGDRALCFVRQLLEGRPGSVEDNQMQAWLDGCQCGWLALMALIAATTLSQAWSAELQASVVRMRAGPPS